MDNENQNRPKDFPADGSDSVLPDPSEWAAHDEEQIKTNTRGLDMARRALTGEVEVVVATDEASSIEPSEPSEQAQPTLSDEVFPFAPETKKPKRKTGKVAFGKFVKTDLYDVFGEYNLDELTEEQKSWMTAERLRNFILTPPREAEFKVDNVPLNPYEYKLVARSPDYLGKSVVASVLHDNDIDDERIASSQRGERHALTAKLETMTEHTAKLTERKDVIKQLIKEAKKPGFAHKTPEEMKTMLGAAWNEFTNILDVVHVQRGWNDETRSTAEAALISYLTTGGQNQRVEHWHKMLGLSKLYLTTRISLFNNRIRRVNSKLK